MTKVNAIQTNENNPYSVFNCIGKGTLGGAALGYATKYWLPVDRKEISEVDQMYFDVIREQAKRAKSIPIEAIRNLEEKTPAQDVFIKLVDNQAKQENAGSIFTRLYNLANGGKKVEKAEIKFNISDMRKIIRDAKLDEDGINELRNIIAQVNKKAADTAKRHISAHKRAIKIEKRPTIAFVTMGAVAGFFGGLIHKVISG